MEPKKTSDTRVLALEQVQPLILTIRGEQVMLDADLARLYGVATKRLQRARQTQ